MLWTCRQLAKDMPGEAPSILDRLDHTRFPTSPSSAEEPELRALLRTEFAHCRCLVGCCFIVLVLRLCTSHWDVCACESSQH